MEIKVTEVRIKKYNSVMRAKAMASIIINNCICINDIRVIEGRDGLFIAMPSRKTQEGDFKDIAHPINSETREIIQKAILEKYKEITENIE